LKAPLALDSVRAARAGVRDLLAHVDASQVLDLQLRRKVKLLEQLLGIAETELRDPAAVSEANAGGPGSLP